MAHIDESLLSVGGLPIQHYKLAAVSEPSAPEASKEVMALLLQLSELGFGPAITALDYG